LLRFGYWRDGVLLAKAFNQIARTPRGEHLVEATGGKPKYETRQSHRYTAAEIEKIEQEVLAEHPRGTDTLYWEDVHVGDTLSPVVKGPLTGTDVVGWYACVHGTQPYGGTFGLVTKYRRRHNDFHFNKATGTKDSAGRGHLETQTGVDVGMGGAYDIGPQRISWFQHMLTNWMGDEGFLRQMKTEVRRPNLLGDTTWVRGKVVAKRQEGTNNAVIIETEAVNQRAERTAWGNATVYLPSRASGSVVLPVPIA
jgi:acyl dehydratase